jgi:amino acid transporter
MDIRFMISLSIAASLAEICAVYPTAGGVYYWSAMLSTRKWAPIVSWTCGWFTLVGNVCRISQSNLVCTETLTVPKWFWDVQDLSGYDEDICDDF